MAGDRTLKLSILADVSNLAKSLNQGSKEVEGFGTQIANISEKAVKAFGAIGLAIGGVSLAFAKAAAEDQAAANKLAQTIDSVTNATDQQIRAVEQYITKTAIATGVTDDQLRPAFERLVRSTKDTEQATKLLNLALDLSAATGKPLEAIANALGRAYDGNTTALGRLGLGIDANLIKSKDFNAIYETLNKTFGEFSETRSEEAIVKFDRLKVALDESKEAIGAALLPAFEELGDWLLSEGVPRLEAFIAGLVGDNSLSSSFTATQKKSEEFGKKVRGVIDTFIEYKDVVITAAAVTLTVFAVSKIAAGVTATIALIRSLIMAYNALKASAVTAAIATAFALNPLAGAAASAAIFAALGLAAKKLSDMDNANLPEGLSYNQQRELQIAQSAGGAGGFAGGVVSGGGGGILGGGGGGGVISTKGTTIKVGAAPTLIEQVSEANAAKYFGTPRENLGVADVRLRELAADQGVLQRIPAGFDPAMVRQGDERGNITINVNAPSIIDKEQFSRAVVDALNETQARTGGGGGQIKGIAQAL